MIYGLLYSPLFSYLQDAGITILPYHSESGVTSGDVLFISVYQGAATKDCFAGISKACNPRLEKLVNPIILLSFLSKEKLSTKDEYGVLSLTGTSFLHLPVSKAELLNTIKYAHKVTDKEMEDFRLAVYKKILRDKIRILKHGKRLNLTDHVIAPLCGICSLAKTDNSFLPAVKTQLEKIKDYTNSPDVSELIRLGESAPSGGDEFFMNISEFIHTLAQLTREADNENIDLTHLSILTEKLDKSFSFISQS